MSEIAKALLKVQMEAPKLQESAVNPHFKSKYVPLEAVMNAVLPILNAHQLVLVQLPTHVDGQPALRTSISHTETAEEITSVMPLTLDKPTMQGYGSALTYARRYAVMSMLGLVADKDDDGAAASTSEPQKATPDERPTEAQHAKLAVMLKELEEKAPTGDGETWVQTAQAYIRNKFNKQSRAHLTRAEMSDLIDWTDHRIKEIGVPFSDGEGQGF